MKKGFLIVIILGLAALLVYKLFLQKDSKPAEIKDAPLRVARNSSAFNASFLRLMNDYYGLKDALVEWDTTKANQAAAALIISADSLQVKELRADSLAIETAKNYMSSISAEAKGLLGEQNIDQKRKDFNMLTSELYDLIRTVRWDGEKVYHTRCPMAFSDSVEGYWLSRTSQIVNPYLGKQHPRFKNKMLGCGEIVDSLDFSKN
ncbi:MAG: DUF3347 domain-containing protein [Chitinophagales bacterium]